MTAKLILPHDAERDEWLEARRAGVTASEVAAVLGLSKYESPRSLYHRKRGEIPDEDDNDAMKWGRRLEAPIADEFADRHPELTAELGGLYVNLDRTWQMATPDRLLYEYDGVVDVEVLCGCEMHIDGMPAPGESAPCCDPDDCGPCCQWCSTCPKLNGWPVQPVSVLEIKTSGALDEWGDDGSDDIPVAYRCQALWQMDVLGLNEARVALLVSGRTYREYTVAYDPDDVALLRDAASDFLDSVDLGTPPDVDATAATADALKHLHPDLDDTEVDIPVDIAGEYTAACAAYKTAEARKKLAENRLREASGRGRYLMSGGQKVATRSVYEVAEHVRKASKVDKFTPARRKQ